MRAILCLQRDTLRYYESDVVKNVQICEDTPSDFHRGGNVCTPPLLCSPPPLFPLTLFRPPSTSHADGKVKVICIKAREPIRSVQVVKATVYEEL